MTEATVTIEPVAWRVRQYEVEPWVLVRDKGSPHNWRYSEPLFTSESLAQARAEGKAEGMRDAVKVVHDPERDALSAEMSDWREGDLRGVKLHMDAFFERAVAAESSLAAERRRVEELEVAGNALVHKLDLTGKASEGIFSIAALHGFHYAGPTYTEELASLRSALAVKQEG